MRHPRDPAHEPKTACMARTSLSSTCHRLAPIANFAMVGGDNHFVRSAKMSVNRTSCLTLSTMVRPQRHFARKSGPLLGLFGEGRAGGIGAWDRAAAARSYCAPGPSTIAISSAPHLQDLILSGLEGHACGRLADGLDRFCRAARRGAECRSRRRTAPLGERPYCQLGRTGTRRDGLSLGALADIRATEPRAS